MADYRKIPCVIQRGGTSKGVYLHEKDLPKEPGTEKPGHPRNLWKPRQKTD